MGSASGREGLAHVHTVIVDEIHALAGNKRGAHLALTLERLQALCKSHCGGSACPLPNARSNGWHSFWWVAGAPAPLSISAMPASVTWPSKCRRYRWGGDGH